MLAGAENIEQTKHLPLNELSLLCGIHPIPHPPEQRTQLEESSHDPEFINQLLLWNFTLAGKAPNQLLYYDPHTKVYTGEKPILSGWDSKSRSTQPIQISDIVHNQNGYPIYIENTDNYEDMRQRFPDFSENLRDTLQIEPGQHLIFVIDRGIFSHKIITWFYEQGDTRIITWEKGFDSAKPIFSEKTPPDDTFSKSRNRNNSKDTKQILFRWREEPWDKNPNIRCFLVEITHPKTGRCFQVSILSTVSKSELSAEQIIWSICNRWFQENDFKYLDTHFGLNQITTYGQTRYEELIEKLKDREVRSYQYHGQQLKIHAHRKVLGSDLLKQKKAQSAQYLRRQKIQALQSIESPSVDEKKKLGQLKGGEKSAKKNIEKREYKISSLYQELETMEAHLSKMDKTQSRLNTLIGQEIVRLKQNRRLLHDIIKIIARNLYYHLASEFRSLYDNYRDDHSWLRSILNCNGHIREENGILIAELILPTTKTPKKVIEALERLMDQLNKNNPKIPNGTQQPILLKIDKNPVNTVLIPNHDLTTKI